MSLLPELAAASVARLNHSPNSSAPLPVKRELARILAVSQPISEDGHRIHFAGDASDVIAILWQWNDEMAHDASLSWDRRRAQFFVHDALSGTFAPSKFCAFLPIGAATMTHLVYGTLGEQDPRFDGNAYFHTSDESYKVQYHRMRLHWYPRALSSVEIASTSKGGAAHRGRERVRPVDARGRRRRSAVTLSSLAMMKDLRFAVATAILSTALLTSRARASVPRVPKPPAPTYDVKVVPRTGESAPRNTHVWILEGTYWDVPLAGEPHDPVVQITVNGAPIDFDRRTRRWFFELVPRLIFPPNAVVEVKTRWQHAKPPVEKLVARFTTTASEDHEPPRWDGPTDVLFPDGGDFSASVRFTSPTDDAASVDQLFVALWSVRPNAPRVRPEQPNNLGLASAGELGLEAAPGDVIGGEAIDLAGNASAARYFPREALPTGPSALPSAAPVTAPPSPSPPNWPLVLAVTIAVAIAGGSWAMLRRRS